MKTKQFFKDNKVVFEFIDYDLADEEEQQRILDEMEKHGGNGSFPFIIIGEDVVIGYNPEKLSKLLGLKK
jgi:arsenate reductase-like glutaredoxin family protein